LVKFDEPYMDGNLLRFSTTFIQESRAENECKGFVLGNLCGEFLESGDVLVLTCFDLEE
jgi:hypothetical protein